MNVMLIGGPGTLTDRLIVKLKKEGHRVFLLTGSRYREAVYERVYERYDFTYENASLSEIFDSAAPDVAVYMGAFDTNYRWKNLQSESANYVSGVINLLSAFAHRKKGRFVYLSSDQVFSGQHPISFSEDETPDPQSAYGIALQQGENLLLSSKKSSGMDILILRISGMYQIPKKSEDCRDRISRLCLEAMRTGQIHVTPGRQYSLLDEGDAVQFIYQAAFAEKHLQDCYHISSGQAVSEKELAEQIREEFRRAKEEEEKGSCGKRSQSDRHPAASAKEEEEKSFHTNCGNGRSEEQEDPYRAHLDVSIVEKNTGSSSADCVVPGNDAFRSEFGINRLKPLEEGVRDTADYMLEHEKVFMQDMEEEMSAFRRFVNGAGWAVRAVVPFLENMVCFIPFFMLNNRSVGSRYFSRIDFYLIYVILFACVYGQQQATFSALLATAGYIFRQMYTRTGLEVLADYNTYVWIAQLFIVGLSVGYLRDQLTQQKDEAKENHSYMSGQLADIEEINGTNVRVKDSLQTQIINEDNSVGKIYEITSSLNQYSADEVLFYAAEALEKIIGTKDVSIYRISQSAYARLFTATSEKARKLGNSVRYMELGELSEAIGRNQVFINRELNPALPMMASAIYEGSELRYLLMIWTLPWEKMTLGESNLLAVTGFLIQNAALNADRYLEAVREERYLPESSVMRKNAFQELLSAYEKARQRELTSYALILFDKAEQDPAAVTENLSKKIRPNDYLGELREDRICALLTNTDAKGAEIVINRFREVGHACRLAKLTEVQGILESSSDSEEEKQPAEIASPEETQPGRDESEKASDSRKKKHDGKDLCDRKDKKIKKGKKDKKNNRKKKDGKKGIFL
ncbi:MAG: NAD(P)-dependent oxidoreductase [Eubacterium sp.]|nr:NAD(P)-dependent oxidoreductase [Eubacterium sp.]